MNARILLMLLILPLLMACQQPTKQRENGWYYLTEKSNDSISSEPIVTVKDFIALKLECDYFGQYMITGTISPHKQKKWAEATKQAVGKRICFVFNNEIITDPQVNCPIVNGRFAISNPHGHDLPKMFEQIRKEKADSIEHLFQGWEKDSLYHTLNQAQRDSALMALDYWDAWSLVKKK